MLLRADVVDGICEGRITHVYRRWMRPSAKAGGRQRTPRGELAIEAVEVVALDALSEEDARAGGYADVEALRAELQKREGDVYRIAVRFDRPDPRLALREDTSPSALDEVIAKLAKKDARGEPWTRQTLAILADNPEVRAEDLAAELGLEKLFFKRRVRQLKELGLTVSFSPGYRLSPRGEAVLAALRATN